MAKKKNLRQMTSLVAMTNPRSPISEQYRTIRANIENAMMKMDVKTILVTSPGAGEGKTMTLANLAVVFAEQGKRVLVIDSDMRKPSLHLRFSSGNSPGLSNVLTGENKLEEVIRETGVHNLNLVPSGGLPSNPSELLSSNRMKELLDKASDMYDLILFDSPPSLYVADGQVLARYCDGAIIVLRNKQTDYKAAIKTKNLLDNTSTSILGAVLNDQEKYKMDHYYSAIPMK
ncbi:CpsD/CapB family tyrosine-protein kinase [Evansella sp. AB-rgal1]|uniref:CpsD/CapB family tyrosine-protein kinase n=1 Tax=Evansella sp. AB-rgal1 TaxID=3242696 RepID=UPI00359ECA1D